ncbi:MAG: pimeloyl-ACP methyl ester carboxylesterase [Cellvibrionaceae bacterium]|jgi:pimeloyl-ACP methyl ester carboxylesterase
MTHIPFHDFGGAASSATNEGQPIIHFAHPNGFPAACFHRFAHQLTHKYRVIGMNARPLWPGSDPAEFTNWKVLADDLIRFLDENKLSGVIGAGISLGAVTTMYAALKRPDLFSKLLLIEPVFLPKRIIWSSKLFPASMVEKRSPAGIAKKRRDQWPTRQEAFDQWRPKRAFKRYSDDTLWDYVNHALVEQPDGSVKLAFPKEWEAKIFNSPPAVWNKIGRITHPTLAIRGNRSNVLFEPQWQRWQKLQPEATFVEIDGAGHMIPLEDYEGLANHILTWLA